MKIILPQLSTRLRRVRISIRIFSILPPLYMHTYKHIPYIYICMYTHTYTHPLQKHIYRCVCASLRGRCKFPFLFLNNAAFAVVQNKEACVRCRAVPWGEKASLCEEARCIFINLVSTGLLPISVRYFSI